MESGHHHPSHTDRAGGMGRTPRFDLPGIPQHVVQRDNSRLSCCLDDRDRLDYLHLLRGRRRQPALDHMPLMDNHVHLLAMPDGPDNLRPMMQKPGRSTSACSIPATAAPARCGSAATQPAWSTTNANC